MFIKYCLSSDIGINEVGNVGLLEFIKNSFVAKEQKEKPKSYNTMQYNAELCVNENIIFIALHQDRSSDS